MAACLALALAIAPISDGRALVSAPVIDGPYCQDNGEDCCPLPGVSWEGSMMRSWLDCLPPVERTE